VRPLALAFLLLLVLMAGVGGVSPATYAHAAPASAVAPASDHPASSAIRIVAVYPVPGATINSQTPTVQAAFFDNVSAIVPSSADIKVDGFDVTQFQGVTVTATGLSYQVPSILKLVNGNHSVTVEVNDSAGNTATYSWGFIVNTSAVISSGGIGINPATIVLYVAIGAGIAGLVFVSYYTYLRRRRRFTFKKYFTINPVNKGYIILIVPLIVAFLFVLIALTYVLRTPGLPFLAPEYVIVAGLFIGLSAYAFDARAEIARVRAYERAFAQFLFEMSDAMRGGLDPAKALVELSITTSNTLSKTLRIAADGIRMGRPFDFVLKTAVAPMRSPLITRYASLIADASSVGGETAAVVYRAAKDMDDFIKIEQERGAALTLPVAILYVSFGVLMAVLFALLNIAPTLGSLNISFITGNPLSGGGGAAAASVPKLSVEGLDISFFNLMAINSLGTGVIIGAFTEGKPKYGLIHSLVLLGATTVAFFLFLTLF
jgi:archaellum biogenesis protein FlaJ (TadC family)